MSENELSKLVIKAQESVSDVKDKELKKIAFEKILDHLLNHQTEVVNPKVDFKKNVTSKIKNKTQKKKLGTMAYIQDLVDDNFFSEPRLLSEVQEELRNRGHHIVVTSLSSPMQKLTKSKVLRRQKSKGEGKSTFTYSNW